jgi:hypothetical protein
MVSPGRAGFTNEIAAASPARCCETENAKGRCGSSVASDHVKKRGCMSATCAVAGALTTPLTTAVTW